MEKSQLREWAKTSLNTVFFQMETISDKVSIVDFLHRFMLERRWDGRYPNANLTKEDEYPLRIRLDTCSDFNYR